MDLVEFLLNRGDPKARLSLREAERLAAAFTHRQHEKGRRLTSQGEPDTQEHVLLSGRAVSIVRDASGREICIGLHQGPEVVTPHIARTTQGNSLVDIEVQEHAEVASIAASTLVEMMVTSEPIREWANAVMREALMRKVGREWCLAALNAAGRLKWFRENYPGYEDLFPHAYIASFLGITPVTLSRARNR